MKTYIRSSVFFILLAISPFLLGKQDIASQGINPDGVSYKVPRFTDSMVFFTEEISQHEGDRNNPESHLLEKYRESLGEYVEIGKDGEPRLRVQHQVWYPYGDRKFTLKLMGLRRLISPGRSQFENDCMPGVEERVKEIENGLSEQSKSYWHSVNLVQIAADWKRGLAGVKQLQKARARLEELLQVIELSRECTPGMDINQCKDKTFSRHNSIHIAADVKKVQRIVFEYRLEDNHPTNPSLADALISAKSAFNNCKQINEQGCKKGNPAARDGCMSRVPDICFRPINNAQGFLFLSNGNLVVGEELSRLVSDAQRIKDLSLSIGSELARLSMRTNGEGKSQIPCKDQVHRGDPISIIVNKIRMPRLCLLCLPYLKDDVVAMFDVDTGEGAAKQPIIVKYVRDIDNYSTMDFRDLTVYSNNRWNGLTQPYLRFRLVDLQSDDNEDMQALLSGTAQMVSSLDSIATSPALVPAINTGIAITRMLVANNANQPIVDYEFQMYDNGSVGESGDSSLTLMKLKKGMFIIMALEEAKAFRNIDIEQFWNDAYFLDMETGMVIEFLDPVKEKEGGKSRMNIRVLETPVIVGSLLTASTGVPAIVKSRTQTLQEKLMTAKNGSADDLKDAADKLKATVDAYTTSIKISQALNSQEAKSAFCENYGDPPPADKKEFSKVSLEEQYLVLTALKKFDQKVTLSQIKQKTYCPSVGD